MYVQWFLRGMEKLDSLFGSCCRFHKTKLLFVSSINKQPTSLSFSIADLVYLPQCTCRLDLQSSVCKVHSPQNGFSSSNRCSLYLSRAQASVYLCFQSLHHCREQRLLSFTASVKLRLFAATNDVVFEPHHCIQRLLRQPFHSISYSQRDIFGSLLLFVHKSLGNEQNYLVQPKICLKFDVKSNWSLIVGNPTVLFCSQKKLFCLKKKIDK